MSVTLLFESLSIAFSIGPCLHLGDRALSLWVCLSSTVTLELKEENRSIINPKYSGNYLATNYLGIEKSFLMDW